MVRFPPCVWEGEGGVWLGLFSLCLGVRGMLRPFPCVWVGESGKWLDHFLCMGGIEGMTTVDLFLVYGWGRLAIGWTISCVWEG